MVLEVRQLFLGKGPTPCRRMPSANKNKKAASPLEKRSHSRSFSELATARDLAGEELVKLKQGSHVLKMSATTVDGAFHKDW